jgi:hypothetical protein
MTRLEARWKRPCREEGLAGAGRLGYAQSALLELSIGIAFTVVKAEPDNKVIGKGTTFEKCRQHRQRHPQQYCHDSGQEDPSLRAVAAACDDSRQPGAVGAGAVFRSTPISRR